MCPHFFIKFIVVEVWHKVLAFCRILFEKFFGNINDTRNYCILSLTSSGYQIWDIIRSSVLDTLLHSFYKPLKKECKGFLNFEFLKSDWLDLRDLKFKNTTPSCPFLNLKFLKSDWSSLRDFKFKNTTPSFPFLNLKFLKSDLSSLRNF